jgi:hypothetical protein
VDEILMRPDAFCGIGAFVMNGNASVVPAAIPGVDGVATVPNIWLASLGLNPVAHPFGLVVPVIATVFGKSMKRHLTSAVAPTVSAQDVFAPAT